MQCPLCLDAPLEPTFVRGVEVDICPRCRGIWLDRGEIDRLGADAPPPLRDDRRGRGDRDDRDDDRRDGDDRDRRRPKQRKSRAKRLADLLDDVLDL